MSLGLCAGITPLSSLKCIQVTVHFIFIVFEIKLTPKSCKQLSESQQLMLYKDIFNEIMFINSISESTYQNTQEWFSYAGCWRRLFQQVGCGRGVWWWLRHTLQPATYPSLDCLCNSSNHLLLSLLCLPKHCKLYYGIIMDLIHFILNLFLNQFRKNELIWCFTVHYLKKLFILNMWTQTFSNIKAFLYIINIYLNQLF